MTKTVNAAQQPAAAPSSDTATSSEVARRPSKDGAGVEGKTQGAWNVDPDAIAVREGFNVRFDMGNIEELADQIHAKLKRDPASGGLIHALGLRRLPKDDPLTQGGKFLFEVIRGNRRTLALRLLRSRGVQFPSGVPANLLDKAMDYQTATIEMFVENTGKPLLPIEQAAGFKRLRDGDEALGIPKMTIRQIEKATGFSDNTINSALALLEADEEVVEAVRKGDVSASVAKNIAVHARGDKAAQRELVREARAAKGNKAATKAVKQKIDAQQRKKHAAKGRTLKIKAIDAATLASLGDGVAGRMLQLLSNAGKKPDFDMRGWIVKDDKLALAASFGALEALKAAAGMKINLEF